MAVQLRLGIKIPLKTEGLRIVVAIYETRYAVPDCVRGSARVAPKFSIDDLTLYGLTGTHQLIARMTTRTP